MRTLNVDLGDRAYPIHIGDGLLDSDHLAGVIRGRQVLVVTNDSIAPLYLDRVLSTLQGCDVATVVLQDGEQYKQIDTLDFIFSEALTKRFSRNATMVALGAVLSEIWLALLLQPISVASTLFRFPLRSFRRLIRLLAEKQESIIGSGKI